MVATNDNNDDNDTNYSTYEVQDFGVNPFAYKSSRRQSRRQSCFCWNNRYQSQIDSDKEDSGGTSSSLDSIHHEDSYLTIADRLFTGLLILITIVTISWLFW